MPHRVRKGNMLGSGSATGMAMRSAKVRRQGLLKVWQWGQGQGLHQCQFQCRGWCWLRGRANGSYYALVDDLVVGRFLFLGDFLGGQFCIR